MSKILVRAKGNLNIVDMLNPDGPVVTLSVETFEQLAAKYGYSKGDPDKVSISRKTAELALNWHEGVYEKTEFSFDDNKAFDDLTFALNSELEVLSESTAP